MVIRVAVFGQRLHLGVMAFCYWCGINERAVLDTLFSYLLTLYKAQRFLYVPPVLLFRSCIFCSQSVCYGF
jgi:hypothetical protein